MSKVVKQLLEEFDELGVDVGYENDQGEFEVTDKDALEDHIPETIDEDGSPTTLREWLDKTLRKAEKRVREEVLDEAIEFIDWGYREDPIGNDEGNYPPFAIMGFEDRPRYNRYLLKKLEALKESPNKSS